MSKDTKGQRGVSTKKETSLGKELPVQKIPQRRYEVDCSKPVEDKVLNIGTFAQFLRKRIKVQNKPGNLGDVIKVSNDDKKIIVTILAHPLEKNTLRPHIIAKRYLKYLTKKFLKHNTLREFFYVAATSPSTYTLKYFNARQDNAEN